MSNINALFEIVIQNNDDETFKKLLKEFPIQELSRNESNQLLMDLLELSEKYNFIEGLKAVLHYWGGMEVGFDEFHGEIYPIIPSLFLDESIPFRILYFIMNSLKDVVSLEEITIELIERSKDEPLERALRNLFDMMGQPSGRAYRFLSDFAFKSENETAINFFSGLQSYYTDQIQKPKYIMEGDTLFDESDLLDLVDDIADELSDTPIDLNECTELILNGLEKNDVDILDRETTRKFILKKLENMDEENRRNYMKQFLSNDALLSDEGLFHIMGPVHPRMEDNLICQRYGGCRMLYCNCLEHHLSDPETGNVEQTKLPKWFKGECDKCKRKIPKRCYAVRCPMPNGGWLGTFCSWNCVYLSGHEADNKFEKQINETKIVDRKEIDLNK